MDRQDGEGGVGMDISVGEIEISRCVRLGEAARRARFKLWRYLGKPEKTMGLILLALLVIFVVFPLVQILIGATTFGDTDMRLVPYAVPGKITLYHWWRVVVSRLSTVLFYKPLLNTMAVGIGVVALSIPLGSLLAWLVVRTDLPLKRLMGNVVIIPYVMPSWVMGLAWFTMFKNTRIGGAPGLLESIGIGVPNWIAYGYIPIVLALTIHYFPFTFVLVSGALATLDNQLEEAGMVLGASRRKVLRKITFPLMLPAIGSAFVLIFSKAIGTFGTPAFLGLPTRYYVMATRIYQMLGSRVEGTAFVLVIFLIFVSALTIYMNAKVLGVRKQFTTISGKGARVQRTKLGKAKLPLTIAVFGFVGICILLPFSLLALQSLTLQGDFNLRELTLHYWIGEGGTTLADGEPGIFRSNYILGGAWNSIKISLSAAGIASVMGMFFGYAVVKARGSLLSGIVENLAFAPYIIPAIAFGGIYLSMFARPWGPFPSLYGTFTLLLLVGTAKRIPFTSRTGISAMMQIDQSLEEAACLRGASWIKRMRRIVIPLGKSGLMAGMILSFISTMRTLSLFILVVSPKTRMLTSMSYMYASEGWTQHANAIAILIVVITLAGYFISTLLGKSKLEHIGGS
jgi:iron(III) transport system permease protein